MNLSAGIVGLPNVGKSTLFSVLTKRSVKIANHSFSTIEPNKCIVPIQDERLDYLALSFKSKQEVNATFEFVDIAGLVKGASKGAGLGNKFLTNIRETYAICHVVRCFENDSIIHVNNKVDPIEDIETINLELIISDLVQVENLIQKNEKKSNTIKEKELLILVEILKKLKVHLESHNLLNSLDLNDDDLKILKSFNFLTLKPMVYVANLDEEGMKNYKSNSFYKKIEEYLKNTNSLLIPISVKMEYELNQLPLEERELLVSFNEETGINQLTKAIYNLLDSRTFFTAGEQETKAWTFKQGMTAPECASLIHTDFQRGFIRAEVYSFDDFKKNSNEQKLKLMGKIRSEGKNYIVKEGDIIFFKFNV